LKILLLNWQDINNPLAGGAEVHMHEIFKRIAARGHDITLYCCDYPGASAKEDIDGIHVIREGSRNFFNYYVRGRYRSELRRQNFDVVIDDINKIPFYTPWYVDEPLIGILHHLFGSAVYKEVPLLPGLYVSLAEQLATKVYRNVPMAVVSESTRQELIGYGFPAENIAIVPNAVNQNEYTTQEYSVPARPIIGHLGRLKKYKSADHLLHAFQVVRQEIPDVQLQIIGDGTYRSALERLSRELGISENVQFLGYLSQKETVQRLQQMTVLANCSAKEGWGLTVIEANSCGVPVVASDVPGLRDSVVDGKTGLLFEYGNIEQLASKLLLLLRDEHLRKLLREEAILWAHSFNWNDSANKMMELIERVVDRKLVR
jgi:glycosyltransferase involved in cell wall biosynthesis